MSTSRSERRKRTRIDDLEELKKIEKTRLKNNLIGIAILLAIVAAILYYRL